MAEDRDAIALGTKAEMRFIDEFGTHSRKGLTLRLQDLQEWRIWRIATLKSYIIQLEPRNGLPFDKRRVLWYAERKLAEYIDEACNVAPALRKYYQDAEKVFRRDYPGGDRRDCQISSGESKVVLLYPQRGREKAP